MSYPLVVPTWRSSVARSRMLQLVGLVAMVTVVACSHITAADFDGDWAVVHRADIPQLCGWKTRTANVRIQNGVVIGLNGGDRYSGGVSANGSFRIVQRYEYEGKQQQNILTGGMETRVEGRGTFVQVGGECRGRVTLKKV